MDASQPETGFGPWNPGIESTIPLEFVPLATLFRPENTASDLTGLRELSDFSGISIEELVAIRPERLAVHELLVRLIADVSVPDGAKYEDLGSNFRRMASTILSRYILPRMDEAIELYNDLQRQLSELTAKELADCFDQPSFSPAAGKNGFFSRFGKARPAPAPAETLEERDARIVEAWVQKAEAAQNGLERSAYEALAKAASAVMRKHGRLMGGADLLSKLAVPLACNQYGSEAIGRHIEPYFLRAVATEGYKLLPAQTHPVIMNVKGASASGKSTLRPMQKELAAKLGIQWEETARITPDIWRKFLLDYNGLGLARKYAGALTGQEVAIVDKKLDRHLVDKGENGQLPHLAIDRFRFDSFVADRSSSGPLIERFGHLVYLFFMITPPEATVERAWERGEQFGRYKAVDDLLYHNVEAYTGMPRLFLAWVGNKSKQIHFEFLDNSVPKGAKPKTVAFGTHQELNVLDIKSLIDVDRFKKINISARRPEDVYTSSLLAPEKNTEFLRKCARAIPVVNFAESSTGRVYAKLQGGRLILDGVEPSDPDVKAGLAAIGTDFFRHAHGTPEELGVLTPGNAPTLGAWGNAPVASNEAPGFGLIPG
ncbi:MAG: hypothetical protein ACLPX9_12825 [Rhodomicrobium sp.]